MPSTRSAYRCLNCGVEVPTWVGRCPACSEWNTLVEELTQRRQRPRSLRTAGPPVPVSEVTSCALEPVPTGVAELDRVMQGGLIPGSATVIGGEPGIGKSTLLLQAAGSMADQNRRVLFVCAEESVQQVRLRAERLGTLAAELFLLSETGLPEILAAVGQLTPAMLVIDSIQTVHDPDSGSAAGSVTQVRDCAQRLVQQAKESGMVCMIVGHVTKDGALAGPRVLEHLVDTVLSFEGERHHALRLLRVIKHRFGSTQELGLFEMTGSGLAAVPDASGLFLADRREKTTGSVVVPTVQGHRPMLIELQALVTDSKLATPRRSVHGLDGGRLALILAVLAERAGIRIRDKDVYSLAVGGVKVAEPGADLALALAVASAAADRAVPPDVVACGEIGLGGELRQVGQIERRLTEAGRLGFCRAVLPRRAPDPGGSIEVLRVPSLAGAIEMLGLR